MHLVAARNPDPVADRVERAAAVPSAAVVCGSSAEIPAQRRLTPRRRLELIHYGIDLGAIRQRSGSGAALRTRYGWGERPLIGIVARLQPWKGQELFLRAAAQIAVTCPEARFAVIGGAILGWEGDYPQQLQTLAQSLGIGDRVVFSGHQRDVYPWFDALDVAVTASEGEPFGLVTVEALALGKPVVGVRSAGTAEIIQDGVSGLLVPPGNATAMARPSRRYSPTPIWRVACAKVPYSERTRSLTSQWLPSSLLSFQTYPREHERHECPNSLRAPIPNRG